MDIILRGGLAGLGWLNCLCDSKLRFILSSFTTLERNPLYIFSCQREHPLLRSMPQIAIIFQEIFKLGGIILKDHIVFGSMAGAIGGAVGLIFSYIMFLLGFTPLSSIHLAAALVTIDVLNLTTGGIIFSIVTHFAVASQFGILLLYILKSSGKDFWIFKGISIGAIFCLVAHSYLIPLMRTDQLVRGLIFNAPSFGTMITTHSLIGLITAFIIVKYYYKFKT